MIATANTPEELGTRLRNVMRGEVKTDAVRLGVYATDASHYQVTPKCVVLPIDEDDAVAAIKVAHELKVPLTPRGGATSLSGQTFGPGIVMDMSKHMDKVLEVNVQEQWARVQPGAVRDRLNAAVKKHGLHFTPDPATGSRATVGGMVGNNTCGTRSVVYGKTIDNVISCRVALADGTVCDFEPVDDDQWQRRAAGEGVSETEAKIYRGVRDLIHKYQDQIKEKYPKVMRRVSGYNLDEFVDGAGYVGDIGPRKEHNQGRRTWNLANIIVGSEGTLAILLEAKLRLIPLPKATAICVVHFKDVLDSMRSVPAMLEHRPSTVELLDDVVMDEARVNAATRDKAYFIEGEPAAIQLVEFMGETLEEASSKAHAFAKAMSERDIGYAHPVQDTPQAQQDVWDTRKLGLGLITNVKGPVKGRDFIEDACVPVEVMAEYIGKIMELCKSMGINRVSKYAHASVGVIHIAPALDLHKEEDVQRMHAIAEQAFAWCMAYGGSWSGEHGDGQLRGQFLPRMFGDELYQAFRELKGIFDPDNLMNPGKVVDAPLMTENLRYGQPGYNEAVAKVTSTFHYRDQGGFVAAVEQCNGVGACRKVGSGTMCPSYMATRDEEHTTRGRANALRLAMSGQLGQGALEGDGLNDVLSLCLSCKACKTECPNAVDMSKLKADHLQKRYDSRGTPIGALMVGNLARSASMVLGPIAPMVNAIQKTMLFRATLEKVAGFDRRRKLPDYASTKFKTAMKKRGYNAAGEVRSGEPAEKKRVVLFNDTYINNFEPHVGISAVELLESCGYAVIVANAGCCMRPALSKGLLRQAKKVGGQTILKLDAYAKQDLPIVFCEPSCASAFKDDLVDLQDDGPMLEAAQRVREHSHMIDQFLQSKIEAGNLNVNFRSTLTDGKNDILLHGHCHQKAIFGTAAMKAIYEKTEGVTCSEVDSGCCGMAGSFGYEHFDVSKTVYEDRLGPAVATKGEHTEIVACGLSCRHQMHDFANQQPKHWVETIRAEVPSR